MGWDWSDDYHKQLEDKRAGLDRDVARHGEQSRQVITTASTSQSTPAGGETLSAA